MADDLYKQDREEMRGILVRYREMKDGTGHGGGLNEESFIKIIDYYDDNDRIEDAYEAAEYGIRWYPYSSSILLKKADLLIAKQQFYDALNILDKVKTLDHSDSNLFILLVESYLGISENETAKAAFAQAMEIVDEEEKEEMLFQMADIFDDYGLLNEVFDCLKEILQSNWKNQEALYKICFWTDYTSRFEESIDLHHSIIDKDPYNYLAWFNLGTAYQGLKLYEKAIDSYLYAVTINEDFDYGYRNLGDAYIRIKDYKSAIDALNKVLELSLPEDIIYEALGYCYEKQKDTVQARAHYRKALHINPEADYLYYKIAQSYMYEEEWEKATRRLERALTIAPEKAEYHFALGTCYAATDRVEDALSAFAKYISFKPTVIKGWKGLIQTLFDNNYMDEALNECEEALNFTGRKPIFLYYKAAILINSGKRKEGVLVLEEALSQAPKQIRHLFNLDPLLVDRPSIAKIIDRNT